MQETVRNILTHIARNQVEILIERGMVMSNEATGEKVTIQELEFSLERALKEITTTMFNCSSELISPDKAEIVPPGLSAIVGFGGRINGFIAIHLSPKSACTLAANLLGMNFDEMDDIVADAMGEMVNMIAGSLKKYASKDEDLFKISIPSIVYGNDYSTHAPKNSEQLLLGVQTEFCTFSVQLVFEAC
jgi:chemotaxis protein CheX